MRKILFRGKTEKGKWIEGDLYKSRLKSIFMISYYTEHGNRMTEVVNPETVGQYTGLTDKNGKKIFEGDIVKYQNGYGHIEWAQLHGAFMCVEENGDYWEWLDNMYDIEVIGNIHDNPEPLKGGEE